jgi:NAD-dependent deacetylase
MAPPSDHEALAGLLLARRRVVAMTGLALGGAEDPSLSSPDGTWAQRASLEAYLTDPAAFWRFYLPAAEQIAARSPTPAHAALATLCRAGIVSTVIAQATDRLQLRVGSPDVIEVYGHATTARCERCGEVYGLPEVRAAWEAAPDGVPRCTHPGCAYPLRPSATMWGEPLPSAAVARAWEVAAEADLFLVIDSSLRTIPISLLPSVPLTRGMPLVIIGTMPTQYDRYARLVLRASSAEVLAPLVPLLCPSDPSA